jgi:hypothetical protein
MEKAEFQSIRNATYADVNRRWAGIPSNHLENLVGAAVFSTFSAEDVASHCAESNLVQAADEAIHQQRRNPTTGRTVQDAIELDKDENKDLAMVPVKQSILQRPAVVDFDLGGTRDEKLRPRSAADPLNMPPLESQTKQLGSKTSQAIRLYLDLREKYASQSDEIRSLKTSLEKHESTRQELQAKRATAGASIQHQYLFDQIMEDEQNATRVIAQLQRKIGELESDHAKMVEEVNNAKTLADEISNNAKQSLHWYRDPLGDIKRQRPGFGLDVTRSNRILRSIESRRVGLTYRQTPSRLWAGNGSSKHLSTDMRKSLLVSRLSHAVTISMHQKYPVYCLRFDKSGRYFVTGADDFLVKVFCLGAGQTLDSTGKGRLGQGRADTLRGAVLVCTLRGHADVINDIDVSSDNCFLATASEDGDCRVWGLKDGAPVAILRGHVGGANMVRILVCGIPLRCMLLLCS